MVDTWNKRISDLEVDVEKLIENLTSLKQQIINVNHKFKQRCQALEDHIDIKTVVRHSNFSVSLDEHCDEIKQLKNDVRELWLEIEAKK